MNIAIDIEVSVKNGALVLTDRQGKAISFSPEQSVQKKVSMITLGELCDLPKIELAHAFGFKTRKSYYDTGRISMAIFIWTPFHIGRGP